MPSSMRDLVTGLPKVELHLHIEGTLEPELVRRLVDEGVPLTVCPLSNVKLRVFDTLADHNLGEHLRRGLRATVNSDDPAYFGGYMNENFQGCSEALGLGVEQLHRLASNAVAAAFVDDSRREVLQDELDAYVELHAQL